MPQPKVPALRFLLLVLPGSKSCGRVLSHPAPSLFSLSLSFAASLSLVKWQEGSASVILAPFWTHHTSVNVTMGTKRAANGLPAQSPAPTSLFSLLSALLDKPCLFTDNNGIAKSSKSTYVHLVSVREL